jgi:hypothetical protein
MEKAIGKGVKSGTNPKNSNALKNNNVWNSVTIDQTFWAYSKKTGFTELGFF